MTKTAYVFPGQGSQSIAMMTEWGIHQELVDKVFEEASDALKYNLKKIVTDNPENKLNQTEFTQPAMLCAGVASWRVIREYSDFPNPVLLAGHSLGEYTALVCSGALSLEEAVNLVSKRGQYMQLAVKSGEGTMAVVLGLDDEKVIEACSKSVSGVVEAANFNAPGQVVIGGHVSAVNEAMEAAKELGAKRVLPVQMSVPSHCSLMKPAAENLAVDMNKLKMNKLAFPIVHNQNAAVSESIDEIKGILEKQLYQPVRWVESVQMMKSLGVERIIECGPGKVLAGLTKRIDKSLKGFAVYDYESLIKTQQSILEP
ncbi:MAG: [acyl-carrier-protein] S-malonyltransferase [Gammaproteobacteria bacterium]|jgi:[acyl-carrier-protein] S-malonyltransferase